MAKGLPARGTQAGGGFLQFFLRVFQHRLHRAHHKRQADEDQRNHNAVAVKGQRDALGLQPLPDPPIAGQQRGQRNARHRSGQGKRQVHQRIHNFLAGERVAHQDPRHQQPKHHVDQGGDQ